MSFLRRLMGGGSGPTVTPDYTGLQIQTAVNALPIPIVWGESKIAPNVIWYNGFTAIPVSSGGSGGSGGKGGLFSSAGTTTGYDYTADLILALCEGPITGINQVWRDQSTYTLADLGLSLFVGTTPQAVWSFLETVYPSQALPYQRTAYCAGGNYDLSDSATIDNHNFEVQGFFYGSGINGVDADPAHVVNDFLVNPQYGVGFPSASIDTTTLFGTGSDASLQTYCAGIGIAISPALTDQETASSILDRWLHICNTAAVWSGGQLRFIPYGDTATVAGTVQSTDTEYDVPESGTFITPGPTIYVTPPAAFVADKGVVYADSGVALSYIGATYPGATGQYGISPAGTYLFNAGDENVGVVISYEFTTGASFVPNVTPIYNLDDDDFMDASNADPLEVSRSDVYESYNVWRLEIAERANAYNVTTVEARDQNAIEVLSQNGVNGMRIAPTFTAHEVCDPNVALISGQLMLQRSVYIRNTYKFKLSWEYCLLDPMDLVTVTDALLGLADAPIRITDAEEDESGFLSITAEEFPLGAASATLYATQTISNVTLNRNAAAPSIAAPILFEPTDELAGGLAVWAGVCGSGPNWGGCDVLVASSEGGPYSWIGTITGPARMGVTTADFPAVAVNPIGQTIDETNTLSVNLSESNGALNTATLADALALNTRCYVGPINGGGEIVAYANAALTAPNQYNLTDLARGGYGTEAEIVDHPAGSAVLRLDGAVFQFPYNQGQIGSTLYFKFPSFNAFGGGQQSQDACGAYSFVLTGAALSSPLPDVTNLYTNYASGFQQIFWDEVDDFRNGIVYQIRQGASFATAQVLKTQAHPPFIAQGNGTFWVTALCQPVAGLTVYSETPSSITIAGNQLSLNLLAGFDEKATGWTGTFQNGIGVDGGDLRLGGSGNTLTDPNRLANPDVLDYGGIITGTPVYYTIPTGHIINAGSVTQASINASTQIVGVPVSQNVLTDPSRLTNPDVLGSASTQYVDGWVEINVSQDGSTWAGWQKFVPGVYPGMAWNFRLALESSDPNTIAYALAFNFTVQLPSRIDHYQNLSVGSGGLTVTFARDAAPSTPAPFNGGPGLNDLPYYSVSNSNPFWKITGLSLSQLTITFYTDNTFATPVAATAVNLDVEGY